MALSGSFNTSGYSSGDGAPDYVTLTWVGTQNIEENYTDVAWTLKVGGGASSAWWIYVYNRMVKINDNEVGKGSASVKCYNGTQLLSGTTRVNHANDGTATLKIYAGAGMYSSGVYNTTKTETYTLDTIPRHPNTPTISSPTTSTISETSKSITVSWSTTNRGTYTLEVSKNGGAWSAVTSGIAIGTLSYTHTITPSQGDTYKYRVKAVWNSLSSSYSESGVVTINKLTAPTIGTLSTYNPYVTSTLSVPLSGGSQTNGGAFMRMAALYYGTTKLATCTTPSNGNTSASITYSTSNFLSKLGKTKYSDTFKIVAWTQNSNGSTSSTVEKTFTVNINSDGGATPTLNVPTLSGGMLGYAASCFVAGISNLTVTSGSAATRRAPSDTTLTYTISCTGATTKTGSSATFTGLTAGKKTITVTVKDSRGLSTSQTVYCRFQSWSKPTVTITKAERNSTTSTTIDVTYTTSYSPIYAYSTNADTAGTQLNGINSQQYTTSSTYTACTSPFSITGTSEESTYTITVRVADKVATSTYGSTSKTVGTSVVYLASRSHGIGLNCIPASGYRLDVNGKARIGSASGGNVIVNGGYITSNITTGTYLKGNTGYAMINSTATAGSYVALTKTNSNNGYFTLASYTDHFRLNYTAKSTVDAGTNSTTKSVVLLKEDGTSDFAFASHTHSGYANSSHTHDYLPLSGGTLTGSTTFPSIELSHSTPFIDFHYGKSTADNTSRIIESASGTLSVNGVKCASGGSLTATNIYKSSSTYPIYGCRVLYSNTTGTTGTVTLSESAANFKYIIIVAGFTDTGASGSLVVYEPNGKTVDVGAVIAASNNGAVHRIRYAISGTTMTPSNNYEAKFTSGSSSFDTTKLCCKAVLGFK